MEYTQSRVIWIISLSEYYFPSFGKFVIVREMEAVVYRNFLYNPSKPSVHLKDFQNKKLKKKVIQPCIDSKHMP